MDGKLAIFALALFMMTLVLVWGLRLVLGAVSAPRAEGGSLLDHALSEKAAASDDDPPPGSISRIPGAFGMTGLAAAGIGIGYWLIYALFCEPTSLPRLGQAAGDFATGGALFAPYAVNRLAGGVPDRRLGRRSGLGASRPKQNRLALCKPVMSISPDLGFGPFFTREAVCKALRSCAASSGAGSLSINFESLQTRFCLLHCGIRLPIARA